ncbi:MAG: hypothetical protein R3A45_12320 [Bdellovibrionota bacterium]
MNITRFIKNNHSLLLFIVSVLCPLYCAHAQYHPGETTTREQSAIYLPTENVQRALTEAAHKNDLQIKTNILNEQRIELYQLESSIEKQKASDFSVDLNDLAVPTIPSDHQNDIPEHTVLSRLQKLEDRGYFDETTSDQIMLLQDAYREKFGDLSVQETMQQFRKDTYSVMLSQGPIEKQYRLHANAIIWDALCTPV